MSDKTDQQMGNWFDQVCLQAHEVPHLHGTPQSKLEHALEVAFEATLSKTVQELGGEKSLKPAYQWRFVFSTGETVMDHIGSKTVLAMSALLLHHIKHFPNDPPPEKPPFTYMTKCDLPGGLIVSLFYLLMMYSQGSQASDSSFADFVKGENIREHYFHYGSRFWGSSIRELKAGPDIESIKGIGVPKAWKSTFQLNPFKLVDYYNQSVRGK